MTFRAYLLVLVIASLPVRAKAEFCQQEAEGSDQWISNAVARSDFASLALVGSNLFTGNGVTKDTDRAVQLFVLAAAHGNSASAHFMGFAYLYGSGVTQNLMRANDWFEFAARDGNAKAQASFGAVLLAKDPPDQSNAFRWISSAAAQGDPSAQGDLAVLYFKGTGTQVDKVKALTWLQLAENGGHHVDGLKSGDISATLSEPEKEEATRKSQAFKKVPSKRVADDTPAIVCPMDSFRIPVRIFGRSKYLVVDTGSSFSSLNPAYEILLEDLHLTVTVQGMDVPLRPGPDIFISDRRVPLLLVALSEMKKLNEVIGDPTDGILGVDVLKNHVVIFDSDAGNLTIGGTVPEHVKESATAIPIKDNDGGKGTFAIEAEINGHGPFLLMIDSGYNGSLTLSEADWKKAQLKETEERNKAVLFGGGIEETISGRAQTVKIGKTTYTNLIVGSGPKSFSCIGQEFLLRHLCVIDFPSRILYLIPGKEFNRKDGEIMSGLALARIEGAIQVYSVAKDSPAFRAGITAGDKLLSINGQDASPMTMSAIRKTFKSEPGREIRMQIMHEGTNKSVTFVLEKSH